MIEETLADLKRKMDVSIEAVGDRLASVRTGTASPAILNAVRVHAYGTQMKIQELATVSAPEPRLLVVAPYDRKLIGDIEKAIQAANLGLNPKSDGSVLRIPIPPLTEEKRREIVKGVGRIIEEGKIAVRNIRREANERLKKAEKAGEISEDDLHRAEHETQKATDAAVERLDRMGKAKEEDVMRV